MNFLQLVQIFDIAGHRALEFSARHSVQLLAKTIYRAGLIGHIKSKANVVPTITSENIARIVHTKNTIKMNNISDDESDMVMGDNACPEEEEDMNGKCNGIQLERNEFL